LVASFLLHRLGHATELKALREERLDGSRQRRMTQAGFEYKKHAGKPQTSMASAALAGFRKAISCPSIVTFRWRKKKGLCGTGQMMLLKKRGDLSYQICIIFPYEIYYKCTHLFRSRDV
jgi:hypothetical protein